MEPVETSSGCCEAVWSRFHPVRFDLTQALMVSLESGIGALEINPCYQCVHCDLPSNEEWCDVSRLTLPL
jgi:hypothetical protein